MCIGIVVICMGIFSMLHIFNLMVLEKENFEMLGLVVGKVTYWH
jgi:uncharacterized membrane protein HdeD (DUF308 family)